MSDIQAVFARRLKRRREVLGWSQAEASRALGRGQSYLSMLESGALKAPALEQAAKIATAYGVSLDWFAGLTDDPLPCGGKALPKHGEEIVIVLSQLSDDGRAELLGVAQVMAAGEKRRRTEQAAAFEEMAAQLSDALGTDEADRLIRLVLDAVRTGNVGAVERETVHGRGTPSDEALQEV